MTEGFHVGLVAHEGRSPRGRGSRLCLPDRHAVDGSIPAWAGEPPSGRWTTDHRGVDPRVGGGAGETAGIKPGMKGRSPRGRGSPNFVAEPGKIDGSIPAWAGEPGSVCASLLIARVDPRVGGGAANAAPLLILDQGRSPRGRGSHVARRVARESHGSIPAWAGEP